MQRSSLSPKCVFPLPLLSRFILGRPGGGSGRGRSMSSVGAAMVDASSPVPKMVCNTVSLLPFFYFFLCSCFLQAPAPDATKWISLPATNSRSSSGSDVNRWLPLRQPTSLVRLRNRPLRGPGPPAAPRRRGSSPCTVRLLQQCPRFVRRVSSIDHEDYIVSRTPWRSAVHARSRVLCGLTLPQPVTQ